MSANYPPQCSLSHDPQLTPAAIGFSYFETLIRQGDRSRVETEVARITSLDQVLLTVGYDRFLFEDMVEETTTLLRDIAARMDTPSAAMALLSERFNSRETSNAIIYHLRLLAASWLKGDPTLYEPFIPNGLGVTGYCTDVIERPDCEIEQLGVMLLVNVLLKPVGFALEIAYLDRSPGEQVNVYRFPDDAPPGTIRDGEPVIHLLFRPDHYDILYPLPPPVALQIHRASFTHAHDVAPHREPEAFASMDYAPLMGLPSFSYAGMGGAGLGSETLAGFVPAVQPPPQQQQQWMPFQESAARPPPQQQQQVPSEPAMTRAAPSPAPSAAKSATAPTKTTYPLRFSSQYYKLDGSTFPEPSFTTAMFKNSHYNKAHYSNPHFHPEEWRPDEGGKRRGRRSEG
ncbi:hypothetical protein IMZ48_02475 [Candidatus Bathyarchaeota archaeon]|nr:hypothetical protein [Candidatus Bathyarchaeota archaeon]